jgi:hypothetical protein
MLPSVFLYEMFILVITTLTGSYQQLQWHIYRLSYFRAGSLPYNSLQYRKIRVLQAR